MEEEFDLLEIKAVVEHPISKWGTEGGWMRDQEHNEEVSLGGWLNLFLV